MREGRWPGRRLLSGIEIPRRLGRFRAAFCASGVGNEAVFEALMVCLWQKRCCVDDYVVVWR